MPTCELLFLTGNIKEEKKGRGGGDEEMSVNETDGSQC